MDFTNVQTALVLLPENGAESGLQHSSVYQALRSSSANITEVNVNQLPTDGKLFGLIE